MRRRPATAQARARQEAGSTSHSRTAPSSLADVHLLRNDTGAPAETIAVQLLPKDAERRIDVPVAPGNCLF